MTHINQVNEFDPSFPGLKPKVSNSKKTEVFENELNRALDKKEAPEMEPANALREIASKDLNIIDLSDIVSGKTDKLLDMLESYSSKLEDPNVSLRMIAPVLEQIKDSADSLTKDAQSLTDADTNLKKIANQTIATVQTEYLKFQRGDYLS